MSSPARRSSPLCGTWLGLAQWNDSLSHFEHRATFHDPATPCDSIKCSAGTFAAVAATECAACVAGQADVDGDSATACEVCPAGTFPIAHSVLGTPLRTACDACEIGRVDSDGDPASPCTTCSPGSFASSPGATECMECAAGRVALDPTTSCVGCSQGRFASPQRDQCLDENGCEDEDGHPFNPCDNS